MTSGPLSAGRFFPIGKESRWRRPSWARLPEDTYRIGVDTGVLDNDSKWRQAVGEITPDYQDVLFKKGFGGILREAEDHLAALDPTNPEDLSKREFYTSVCWTSRGIIRYANRYAQAAEAMAEQEKDPVRAQELRRIARNCRRVPEHPPESFYEAIQFLWFVQVGGILSENPLSLNPGRFDQYMAPYYEADLAQGTLDEAFAQELVDALWLKYSEWVWTISANTADYFAGYNQFQNLTVGGKRRDGKDGTNPVTYLALKATEEVKTHQPGLSVPGAGGLSQGISGRGDPPGVQRHWVPRHSQRQRGLSDASQRRLCPGGRPGLEQLRLRGAPLPEDGGVDRGGEHELWLCPGVCAE